MSSRSGDSSAPVVASGPSTSTNCIMTTVRGTAIGAVLGGGFHLIAGPTAIVIGQPNLRMQQIVRGAAAAAGRLGFVFGVFSSVRCGVESQLAMPISAPFIAGAVAVALPTALDRKRQEFLTAYFKEHAGQALRGRSVVLASAVSGSIMFGCVDSLLRYTGVRW